MSTTQRITSFLVQKWDDATASWRSINTTIRVASYVNSTTPLEAAARLARAEADRQVSGWQAAYPTRRYRTQPHFGY